MKPQLALSIKNLKKVYPNRNIALDGVDFSIPE
jgi:ABC-type phosphate/phosphonate transport system ATPase subunit